MTFADPVPPFADAASTGPIPLRRLGRVEFPMLFASWITHLGLPAPAWILVLAPPVFFSLKPAGSRRGGE